EQFLASGEKPLAIIGVFASALTTTVARVTERAKVPLLSTSFSDDLTKQGYKYFFQITPQASKMGTAQMNYGIEVAEAANKPVQNIAIVYANNAYGVAQAEALKSQAESHNRNIVLYEGYDPTITDAGPIVTKIKAASPDA